ncbi:hypothetical protein QN277_024842 [Acacia crassicarpa]|uniref:PLAT domain-containing protein n=1 Tax=Acacia crassicarpa TaxID=499986 RepID=A0AAE1JCY2_9FABA|nr:hypothetical protein QN277_024842 [Acacia crassicarpa]
MQQNQCQYLVRVQTGDRSSAGTDSKISLKLFNTLSGESLTVKNLEDWGIMAPGHNYFERGNLDVFSRSSPCIDVCAMTVTSDNTGYKPGWFLDFVEVTISGSISKKISFPVNRWLDSKSGLTVTVDLCSWRGILNPALFSV